MALGVLTAYAQGWLPQQMSSLANSAGSWALVAFALSLMATSGRLAAAFGAASLLGLLAGYVLERRCEVARLPTRRSSSGVLPP